MRQLHDAIIALLVVALIGPSGYAVQPAAVFGASPYAPASTIQRSQPDATPVAVESAGLRVQHVRTAARSSVTQSVVVPDRIALPAVRRLGDIDALRCRPDFASSSGRLAVRGPPLSH
jgi:hypothetical protein